MGILTAFVMNGGVCDEGTAFARSYSVCKELQRFAAEEGDDRPDGDAADEDGGQANQH